MRFLLLKELIEPHVAFLLPVTKRSPLLEDVQAPQYRKPFSYSVGINLDVFSCYLRRAV